MRRILDPLLAHIMALPIAAKLWLGFGALLVLLFSLSLTGWFALGRQSERAALAERAGQMTSGLRLVRQDEKNFMLRGEPVYVDQVDSALAELRQNAAAIRTEVNGANAERMPSVASGLPEPGSGSKSAASEAGETSDATAEPRSWSFRPGLGMGEADTPQARRVGGGEYRDRRRHGIS